MQNLVHLSLWLGKRAIFDLSYDKRPFCDCDNRFTAKWLASTVFGWVLLYIYACGFSRKWTAE